MWILGKWSYQSSQRQSAAASIALLIISWSNWDCWHKKTALKVGARDKRLIFSLYLLPLLNVCGGSRMFYPETLIMLANSNTDVNTNLSIRCALPLCPITGAEYHLIHRIDVRPTKCEKRFSVLPLAYMAARETESSKSKCSDVQTCIQTTEHPQ